MIFVPFARAYSTRLGEPARPPSAYFAVVTAKLIVSFEIIRLLAIHYFRSIYYHYFAMRCFRRPLGGPRQTNTRGGEP